MGVKHGRCQVGGKAHTASERHGLRYNRHAIPVCPRARLEQLLDAQESPRRSSRSRDAARGSPTSPRTTHWYDTKTVHGIPVTLRPSDGQHDPLPLSVRPSVG
jgi:hypothetical protein